LGFKVIIIKTFFHMRISLNFLLSVFFTFNAATVWSSIIAPNTGCDTLITKMGQVVLVQILPSSDDQTVRFTYCGEKSSDKTYEIARKNIAEIRKSTAPAESLAKQQDSGPVEIPDGSTPLELEEPETMAQDLPVDSKPLPPEAPVEPKSITLFAKMAAIGGFGSLFMVAFAAAFTPLALILVLPLSIIGMDFSSMVLKRTKKQRAEFLKQRRLAKWSMAMSISWLGLAVLYVLLLILFLFIFFI